MHGTTSEVLGHRSLARSEVTTIIIGVLVAMLLAALDQTIVATALPTIGRALGDIEDMAWVVTAYLLASTAVTPLYGKFSDIHGRRVTLLIGITTFVVGSVACALAPSMLMLILARGLQGLGGGGLISLAQTIIADIVSPRERARYQVYIASVFASSSLLGPVLGGLLAEHLHWSLIFWINVPLGALALLMTNAALKKLPRHDRPHKLDYLGAALMTSGTICLLLALSWGGLRYPWTSLPVLGLLSGALLLWAAFAVRLVRAEEPFIPPSILSNQVVRTGTLAACFGMGTFIGLTIYVPIFFEAVKGLSASNSGLALIPLMGGTVTGATISGRMMARGRHYKRLPMMGLTASIAATTLLAIFAAVLPIWGVGLLLAVISLGLGTLLPVSTVAVQNAVALHELGTATGVANFFRQLGGAIIVAGFGAILLAGTASPTGAGLSFEILTGGARGNPEIAGVFRLVFIAAAICLGLALTFLCLMEERPLRGNAQRAAEAAIAD